VLEIVLRLLPVSAGLKTQPISTAAPVYHFEPNREFTHSAGWTFRHRTPVRVNNVGFVHQRDFDATLRLPLLAVIGDSYVEGLIIEYSATVQGCLQQWVNDQGRVYSFAAFGAPLSQYLVWAEYAAREFAANKAVFCRRG
jgi:hypothetical protein